MVDRQKAIEAFIRCGTPGACSDKCAYFSEGFNCYRAMKHDLLELLKEQGAVEPEVQIQNEIDRIYRCPKCHKAFFYMNQRYCDYCGQAVKWDG